MAEINEGDWGGENLPLFIREHIREFETAVERLNVSAAALRSAIAGVAVGAAAQHEAVAVG